MKSIIILGFLIGVVGLVLVLYQVQVSLPYDSFLAGTRVITVSHVDTIYPYRIIGFIVLLVGGVTFVIGVEVPSGAVSETYKEPLKAKRRANPINDKTEVTQCNFQTSNDLCSALVNEGADLREEKCMNIEKTACCYLCDFRSTCDIGCDYKGENAIIASKKKLSVQDVDAKIAKFEDALGRLAENFAENKISEETYFSSVKAINAKINDLSKLKKETKTT